MPLRGWGAYSNGVSERMGGIQQWCPYRQLLEHIRGNSSHQCTGDACRIVWDQMLCTDYLELLLVRQRHGCGVCQSARGHQIENPLRHCGGTLAVVPGPRDHNYSPASTRAGECPSRFHVQTFVTQEVESSAIQFAEPAFGPVFSHPVCNQADEATTQVLKLEVGSRVSWDGCTCPRLERQHQIYTPFMVSNRATTPESNGTRGHSNSDRPGMAQVSLGMQLFCPCQWITHCCCHRNPIQYYRHRTAGCHCRTTLLSWLHGGFQATTLSKRNTL